MKHDMFVIAPDMVAPSFVRSLGWCMMVGASFWTGLLLLAI